MENKEPIKSPYMPAIGPTKEDEKFLKDLDAVCRIHGHPNYFFSFSKKINEKEEQWNAFSTVLNKSMLDALKHIIRGMEEALKKIQK